MWFVVVALTFDRAQPVCAAWAAGLTFPGCMTMTVSFAASLERRVLEHHENKEILWCFWSHTHCCHTPGCYALDRAAAPQGCDPSERRVHGWAAACQRACALEQQQPWRATRPAPPSSPSTHPKQCRAKAGRWWQQPPRQPWQPPRSDTMRGSNGSLECHATRIRRSCWRRWERTRSRSTHSMQCRSPPRVGLARSSA